MRGSRPDSTAFSAYRRLVQRVLEGGIPRGNDFDACRALLRSPARGPEAYQALCVLLEGALADPDMNIAETRAPQDGRISRLIIGRQGHHRVPDEPDHIIAQKHLLFLLFGSQRKPVFDYFGNLENGGHGPDAGQIFRGGAVDAFYSGMGMRTAQKLCVQHMV